MGKIVCVSYCHQDGDWVWNRLVLCLRHGGAVVLIDLEQFVEGEDLRQQMDAMQDKADVIILVLTHKYLASPNCVYEMNRAIALHRQSPNVSIITVKLDNCSPPDEIEKLLYVDFSNGEDAIQWDKLMQICRADLGANPRHYLSVLEDIEKYLAEKEQKEWKNLEVSKGVKSHELISYLHDKTSKDLVILVDLECGSTVTIKGFVEEVLRGLGIETDISSNSSDQCLSILHRTLSAHPESRLVLLHFDLIKFRNKNDVVLLLFALNHLVKKSLGLLTISHTPIADLLREIDPSLLAITTKTIKLKDRE